MPYEKQFSDLDAAVADVQAHFRQRIEASAGAEDALCRLQLAVHEWMANLVRHACFGERTPAVHVRIWQENGHFCCIIEDNAPRFDLEAQVDRQPDVTHYACEQPDGGMGLTLLKAGTERAEYIPLAERLNRLHLSVCTREAAEAADDGGAAREARGR